MSSRVGDELVCKRVEFDLGTLSLISDNQDFPTRTFDQSSEQDVEIIGKVLSQQSEVV